MSYDVFLSYGRPDEEAARELHARLSDHHLSVFFDKTCIAPGAHWRVDIEKAIRSTKVFVACLSQRSIENRGYVHTELRHALEVLKSTPSDDVYLIPVRLDDCEIPFELRHLNWVDYFQDGQPARLVESIEARVRGVAKLPVAAAVPINERKPLRIGVDVGTTKIACGIVSFAREDSPVFVLTNRLDHEAVNNREILDRIEAVIRDLLTAARLAPEDVESIGVGMPGQVDHRTGYLRFAPGLGLLDINVKRSLEQRFGRPVFVDNDVHCATRAELRYGCGRKLKNFVCIFVGSGIGAGIVADGRLLRGFSNAVGEVGHMKIDRSHGARKCTCGAHGCLEEYASARAVVRMARQRILEMRHSGKVEGLALLDPESLTPPDVVRLIESDDKHARDIACRIADALAIGLSNVANILNPEAIVLGGGVIEGFHRFNFFSRRIRERFSELTLDVGRSTVFLTSQFSQEQIYGAASLGADDTQ
ncbi:MAG: ROK family protein [Vicinamibacterales bacterium]